MDLPAPLGPSRPTQVASGSDEIEAGDGGHRPVALHDALEAQGGIGDRGHGSRMTHPRRGHAPGGARP